MKNSITPNYKRTLKGLAEAKLQRAEKKAITKVRMQMSTLQYATKMWETTRNEVNKLQDDIHAVEFETFRIVEGATVPAKKVQLYFPVKKTQTVDTRLLKALKKERDIWADVVKELGRNVTSERVFGRDKVYGSFNGDACRLLKTYTEPLKVEGYVNEFYCILLNEGEVNEKILTVGCNEVVVY